MEDVRGRIARADPEGLQVTDDYRLTPPTLTYTDQINVYLGDHEIQAIHMPGHTTNQTVVWVPRERVLMTGGNISCAVMPTVTGADFDGWFSPSIAWRPCSPSTSSRCTARVCDVAYLREFGTLLRDWIYLGVASR